VHFTVAEHSERQATKHNASKEQAHHSSTVVVLSKQPEISQSARRSFSAAGSISIVEMEAGSGSSSRDSKYNSGMEYLPW
jgi:hypothetical protein